MILCLNYDSIKLDTNKGEIVAKDRIIQLTDNEENRDALFIKISLENITGSDYVLVDEAHTAIIIKDGQLGQSLSAGKHQLSKLVTAKNFAEIVFFAKTSKINMLWGTKQQFDFRDPVEGIFLKVGANGSMEVQITSPRKFYLELGKGKSVFQSQDLKERIQSNFTAYLEEFIGKAMTEMNLSYDFMEENKTAIAKKIKPFVSNLIERDFGIKISSLTINGVIIPNQYINQLVKAREQRLALSPNKAKQLEQEQEQKQKQINQQTVIAQNNEILKEQKRNDEQAQMAAEQIKEPIQQQQVQTQQTQQEEEEGMLLS